MADATIPAAMRDLFTGKYLATVCVITPSGFPNASPVWIDLEGNNVLVNTLATRVKGKAMQVGAKVSVSIVDPANGQRYISVQGVVTENRADGARAHADKLSQRYMGVSPFPYHQPGDKRVLYVIKPVHVKQVG
jgi:hypothetical protein